MISRAGAVLGPVLQALAFGLLVVSTPGQGWRTEKIDDVLLQIDAPGRLERLPQRLGAEELYKRARFRPKDHQDFVRARYYWYCDVYEFREKVAEAEAEVEVETSEPETNAEKIAREISAAMVVERKRHEDFQAWLEDQEDIEVKVEGKPKKARRGKLPYEHWVWIKASGFGPVGLVYCEAAVYQKEGREVALVIEMPLETERPGRPKSKWSKIIKRMIASGTQLDPVADTAEPDARDRHADTPEKKAALAAAKDNIKGHQGWDYFTSPNYIVIYSWDFEKPDARSKSMKSAEFYASRLERMRDLYIDHYPLDETGQKAIMPDPATIPSISAPITGPRNPEKAENEVPQELQEAVEAALNAKKDKHTVPYSVFRLCATYDQFRKYGQSPPGVVGWFSPISKELVVFLGGDKMMGKGATETVVYHEGWHQFADLYFNHPDTPKNGDLQRWFDEGHGDYFGSFRWGSGGWRYSGSKMRYSSVKEMVRVGDYVPFKEIVTWHKRRFYTGRPPYYYAQAYSMIDYLRRGNLLKKYWKPEYGDILDMYRKVMLVHGDEKLAVNTAFRDMTDEDWVALEDAWKAWVGSKYFKRGR